MLRIVLAVLEFAALPKDGGAVWVQAPVAPGPGGPEPKRPRQEGCLLHHRHQKKTGRAHQHEQVEKDPQAELFPPLLLSPESSLPLPAFLFLMLLFGAFSHRTAVPLSTP